jgi:hypothetical protein
MARSSGAGDKQRPRGSHLKDDGNGAPHERFVRPYRLALRSDTFTAGNQKD